MYIGIMIGSLAIALLMMPIWYIRTIEVVNNRFYTEEEIISASKIQEIHLLDLSFKKAKRLLLELPYMQQVKINYSFPGKVTIDVVEKEPFIYVPFMGTYLCLNEQGQVIEQTSEKINPIPEVKGLIFTEFKIGELLPIENEDTLLCTLEIMNILKSYEYVDKIKSIDVYNLEEIHLYVDNLDVIMGDIGDFGKKLQWLIEAHKTYDMGKLDLSYIKNGQAFLSPIT